MPDDFIVTRGEDVVQLLKVESYPVFDHEGNGLIRGKDEFYTPRPRVKSHCNFPVIAEKRIGL
ncbi:MAG: hypothetical protein WD960_15050 [Gemmatimonadota bacterium]